MYLWRKKQIYQLIIDQRPTNYRNDPKFSEEVWSRSAAPDQTAPLDQGLHCLTGLPHSSGNKIPWQNFKFP